MALGLSGGEIGAARCWTLEQVEHFGWGAGWRPDSGTVALVVSELVTNALRHAGGGRVGVCLVLEVGRLRIAVSDESRHEPVIQPPGPGRVGGHGLRIVASVAARWGVRPHGTGKEVWADLLPQHPTLASASD